MQYYYYITWNVYGTYPDIPTLAGSYQPKFMLTLTILILNVITIPIAISVEQNACLLIIREQQS